MPERSLAPVLTCVVLIILGISMSWNNVNAYVELYFASGSIAIDVSGIILYRMPC